ncbi:Uncharacterized protein Rs2_01941 [Raphanus sativus]|nr:Uncharacterized protein Rs2_01941 [Raphanus sativus]
MAEIEKIHRSKSESKFLGIKKDVLGFLSCLRDFDFRCFGAFPPSGTVFSNWLTFLHEKQNVEGVEAVSDNAETAVPPPNALLLMRCRSAPEEENVKMVVMDYDTNYYKLSSDIAKETWVVGGIQDSLFRSRSWNK